MSTVLITLECSAAPHPGFSELAPTGFSSRAIRYNVIVS
ncbi:MAG: hypothetical protein JWP25_399 [Bradyrhizobium sp.]|jgi:hypothetical protein|nr:hypothetical protein [Bradyrhizobium sp.]MEA2867082.1 hypothetical protein [Bradyrhizobium sp.]